MLEQSTFIFCRPEKAHYVVKLDQDELDGAGLSSHEAISVPIDRIRPFIHPWNLDNLPSPPFKL